MEKRDLESMTNDGTASEYIKQVIETGTAHERITLFATSAAHWAYGKAPIAGEPPLTAEEHWALLASFKSVGDKKVLERYNKIDNLVKLFIVQLSQYLIEQDAILAQIKHLNTLRIMFNVTVPQFCDVIWSAIAKRLGWEAQVEIFQEASKHKLASIFGSKTKLEILRGSATRERYAAFSFPDYDLPATAAEISDLSEDAYFLQCLKSSGNKLTVARKNAKVIIIVTQEILKANRFGIKPYKYFLKRSEKRLRQEPALAVLATTEELRQAEAKASKGMKQIYKDLISEQEKKRALLWRTYDEIEVTDENKKTLRNVAHVSGVSYAKR